MTIFYCFPSNQGFASEFVKDGISVSVIGDYYKEDIYIGYLVNSTALVEEWSEHTVIPDTPMRIFG